MDTRTNKFYNRFSHFYPLVDIFLKPQKRKLLNEINSFPSGRLLEIGVGNGSHLSLYKTHSIIGIDTSSSMLKIANKKKHANIELIQMNGEKLQFEEDYFDYLVLSHVIAVTNNPETLLKEAYRVLKPNGKIFILNHFTPENWLRHIDKMFNYFSKLFHFKSLLYIDSIETLKKFQLLKETKFGYLSYFKLLILCKV